MHPLPGHTLYAVAISLEVDGKRVLITGDQYQGNDGQQWNYVYQNRFGISDYMDSAALYASLQPEVILTGHWDPLWVQAGYYDELTKRWEALKRLHRELLPLDEVDFGAEGFAARFSPYQSEVHLGESIIMKVDVMNPYPQEELVEVKLVLPSNWRAEPQEQKLRLASRASGVLVFVISPTGIPVRRARVAAGVTVNGKRLG